MNIQLVIPMSGQGTRYRKAGYDQPKPLIPVNGRPMIERLLEKFPADWPCTFVIADNHKETELPNFLKKLRPNGQLLSVPVHTKGPSFALKVALDKLNPNDPVLVSYCDYGQSWDPWDFKDFVKNSNCDAAVISYRGFHAHYLSPQMYAYCRLENGLVREIKEKGSFTNNRENEFASTGAYYFKSANILKEAIEFQEKNNLSMNGELYTSLTIQALLQKNPKSKVKVYEIPAFFQWGTPEDLATFEYWEKTYTRLLKHEHVTEEENLQILMPMAGLGSRFKDLYQLPKPFLKINSIPMYRKALNSLPTAEKNYFVTLSSVKSEMKIEGNEKVCFLEKTPEGQALSAEAGLELLQADQEVIVSACDHGIVLSPEKWSEFQKQKKSYDAAIFTAVGFPGAIRRPQAFAYVSVDNASSIQSVKAVSVKKPLSDFPSQDPLLVGTFWFKNKDILKKGIALIKKNNVRVNGELYLDSVFNLLIDSGLKIANIPLDGYINWGDPDSLAEALYWSDVFCGQQNQVRSRYSGVTE